MRVFNRKLLNTLWADLGSRSAVPDIKVKQGWTAEKPPFEYENERRNFTEEAIAYLYQNGIAEWAAGQEYVAGALCKSSGVIYKALVNTTGHAPASSPAKWVKAFEDYQDVSGKLALLREYVDDQDIAIVNSINTLSGRVEETETDLATHMAASNPHPQYANKQNNDLAHHDFDARINALTTALEQAIIDQRDRFFPVGKGIYIVYDNSNPATRLGFGVWRLLGEGQALVGLSDVPGHPTWTKTIGSTFGEYKQTLTVDQTPPHSHTQWVNGYDYDNSNYGKFASSNSVAPNDPNTGSTRGYWPENKTSEVGGGQPHNNVQPSFVVAIWLRVG